MLVRVVLGRQNVHLSFEGQMEAIADQELRYARCMLLDLLQPSIETGERPLVRDVVDEQNALCATRVGPDDRSEAALSGCVPSRRRESGELLLLLHQLKRPVHLYNSSRRASTTGHSSRDHSNGGHFTNDLSSLLDHSTSKQKALTRVEF